jgi:hypothetical protein
LRLLFTLSLPGGCPEAELSFLLSFSILTFRSLLLVDIPFDGAGAVALTKGAIPTLPPPKRYIKIKYKLNRNALRLT